MPYIFIYLQNPKNYLYTKYGTSLLNVFKSPVLHFIILGSFVFGAYVWLKPPDRETIQVTTQTIDALVQQRENIAQTKTTPEERQDLIVGYIEDEILLREAYKRGFDKNDYRVRKRILNIMRSSLSDVRPEPSQAQLRAYYEENRERYQTQPSRTFEQVYFSFTNDTTPVDPKVYIKKLERTGDISKLGEFALLGNRFSKISFERTAMTFGKPFAEHIFSMPLSQWQGPVESFRGVHYVRVTATHEPELPPFENLESFLRTDYQMVKTRESQMRKIEDLMKNYEVVVEGQ